MGLRINKSNISQMRINGVNIKLAKINSSIVFEINGEIITLSFNDKTISAISNKSGSYDFYYAKNGKKLEDYDKIVSFDLTANVESSYTYLNSFNIAPYDANEIVVCKSGTTKVLSSSLLPSQFLFNSSSYGNKLYSFGALSDVHIDGDGTDEASASSDLVRALIFFNSNASLVCISGDLTCIAGYSELSLYKDLVDNNATIPVYESRGNHDCRYSLSDFENCTGGSLYFEKSYNNDKFIFLGMNAENYGDNCFTTEELDWLETKLESYKNQRVFLFFHVFMPDTCGNINNLYPYSSLDTSSTIIQRFISLMTAYKNVIYFSGHSHLEFACQRFGSNANIFSNGSTCHRVHIPSCAKPRKNDTGTSSSNTYQYDAGSQGYLVDVYENCIVLRGRDFEKGKFLPIANYLLDTTLTIYKELIKTFYGDSKQNTTTGKNLSPQNSATTTSSGYLNYSSGTFGYVEADKTYTLSMKVNKQSTNTNWVQIRCYTSEINGTNQGNVANFNLPKESGIKSVTFTSSYTGYLVISAGPLSEVSYEIFTEIQLQEGSTATEYEPYTGGIASPNPDYPQEIQTIVGASLKLTNETDELLIPIDLKGYVLAKVGDIADELKIYSNGDVSILKNIDKISNYNGETISTDYLSTTGELTTGATIYYVNNEPQTIALDNIKSQLDSFGTYSSMELVVTYSGEIVTDNNLLKLLEGNAEWVSYNGTEASVDYNSDNTLTVTADGSSDWGLNISQPGLTLSAGKTYRLSCDNIGSSTWISVNNDDNKMLHSSKMSVDFTPSTDKVDPVIYIWVNSGVVYDNVVWNIRLEEV